VRVQFEAGAPRRARTPPTQLRYAGAAAVATLWASVGIGMYRTGLDFFGDRPVSYLGTDPRSAAVFRGGLILAAGLMAGFSWFVFGWFAARRSFLATFLIGLVGQVVVAVVLLSGPGSSHAVHTVGGLVLGASLPILMWRFAAGIPSESRHSVRARSRHSVRARSRRRIESYGLCWLEVAACTGGVALSASMRAPVAEIVPALAFHVWVAVVTVWSTTPVSGPDGGKDTAGAVDGAGCGGSDRV